MARTGPRALVVVGLLVAWAGAARAGSVRVETRSGPGGPGVAEATVLLDGADPGVTTGEGGAALLEDVPEGLHEVRVALQGYFPVEPTSVLVGPGEATVAFTLHPAAIPTTDTEDWADDGCGAVTWDEARLEHNVLGLVVQAVAAGGRVVGEHDDAPRGGKSALCLEDAPPDGSDLWVAVSARYADGSVGPRASSASFVLDRSRPDPGAPEALALATEDCVPAPGAAVPVRITFRPDDPHTGLTSVAWRRPGEGWTPVAGLPPAGEPVVVVATLASPARGTEVEVRAINGVGLVATAATTILGPDCRPEWTPVDPGPVADGPEDAADAPRDVPSEDAAPEPGPTPDPGAPPVTQPEGGCAGGEGGAWWTALLLLAWLACMRPTLGGQ